MMSLDEFRMRLNLEIEIAKKKFARSQNRSTVFGAMRRTTTEKEVSGIRQKSDYFQHIAGDKYLSEEEYVQIVALRSFIAREPILTDDKIELLIMSSAKEFPILNDLLNRLPDAIDELRTHGAMSVAMMYKQRKYIDTRMEEITEKESVLNK